AQVAAIPSVAAAMASALARTTRAALGTHRIAAPAGDQARRGRRVTAPIPLGTRTYLQRNPAAGADPQRRMRGGRNELGRVRFGDFLLHEQEKATRLRRVEALLLMTYEK